MWGSASTHPPTCPSSPFVLQNLRSRPSSSSSHPWGSLSSFRVVVERASRRRRVLPQPSGRRQRLLYLIISLRGRRSIHSPTYFSPRSSSDRQRRPGTSPRGGVSDRQGSPAFNVPPSREPRGLALAMAHGVVRLGELCAVQRSPRRSTLCAVSPR